MSPGPATPARGAVPDVDQVIQSESEILGSGELRERVIRKVGFGKDLPRAPPPSTRRLARGQAQADGRRPRRLARNLKIETAPDNSIIRLAYANQDPEWPRRCSTPCSRNT
jgi:uncharacterized protein involved in exopolysaccharide biosynthesis